MAVDMAISATEKPLGKVFTSDYQLTIPSFQRAYTWQAENIEQLVNDLQDACTDPDTPYFLGSLILVKDGPSPCENATPTSSACTCRKAIWKACSI